MKKIFFILCFIILLISGCNKQAYNRSFGENTLKFKAEKSPMNEEALGLVEDEKEQANRPVEKNDGIPTNNNIDTERKRIKSGQMTLEVKDLSVAEKQIEESLKNSGGYVSSSNFYQTSLNLVVRIPADNFDAFLVSTESIGKLNQKSINVQDVTQNYFDLENKIKNKRILQERYQSYLRKAANTKELLEIEKSVNDVTTEVESLEGSFRLLNNQISYSTLNLNLNLPVYENIARSLPSIKKGFKDFGFNFLKFLYVVLFIILYLLVFGLPILIVISLFYFVGFGKVGIIRKLFKLLSLKK